MNINTLVGTRLEGVRFSKGSYCFDFSGEVDTFYVSTPYYFFVEGKVTVGEPNNIPFLWDFLEKNVASIVVENSETDNVKVVFQFEGGIAFCIWSQSDPIVGELLMVEIGKTGKWFTVG